MSDGASLIAEGARLAGIGMTTVFVFLTALVIATSLMSRLVIRFAPAPELPRADRAAGSPDETHLPAIITAAVHAHRSRRR